MSLDISSIRFGDPTWLWLQVVPAALLVLWARLVLQRRRDLREFRRRRYAPTRDRLSTFGPLPFWLAQIVVLALLLLSLSRPRAAASLMRTAGVDVVVLQDGSASMYVRDVKPDRWQRSVRFLRVLAESLQWRDDRIALALFAHIAAPQVRLTRDANTFFFFLDHLQTESPFPLNVDTTWDTNIELGIHWGASLIEKDEELNGRSPNAKVFVLVSDGQAWSGEIAQALALAGARDIPVHVVGVGTAYGGYIPQAPLERDGLTHVTRTASPLFSVLDRPSLEAIAAEGGGRYFDLEREGDRAVATAIIFEARRRAGTRGVEESFDELYWYCLAAAGAIAAASVLWLPDVSALWLVAGAAGAALAAVAGTIR